jgi:PKHD-type hydroxylase
MFHTIKLIENDSVLTEINSIFDRAEFSEGLFSGDFIDQNRKNNCEMICDQYYSKCDNLVNDEIDNCFTLRDLTSARKVSKLIFSEYKDGMYYKNHYDHCAMDSIRTDYSCTLFLNNPEDYEGGELVIDLGSVKIPFKLKSGEVLLYPTKYRHQVKPVTSGKRRVCVFWLESIVNDPIIREIVQTLSNTFLNKHDEIKKVDVELWEILQSIHIDLKRNYGNHDSKL